MIGLLHAISAIAYHFGAVRADGGLDGLLNPSERV